MFTDLPEPYRTLARNIDLNVECFQSLDVQAREMGKKALDDKLTAMMQVIVYTMRKQYQKLSHDKLLFETLLQSCPKSNKPYLYNLINRINNLNISAKQMEVKHLIQKFRLTSVSLLPKGQGLLLTQKMPTSSIFSIALFLNDAELAKTECVNKACRQDIKRMFQKLYGPELVAGKENFLKARLVDRFQLSMRLKTNMEKYRWLIDIFGSLKTYKRIPEIKLGDFYPFNYGRNFVTEGIMRSTWNDGEDILYIRTTKEDGSSPSVFSLWRRLDGSHLIDIHSDRNMDITRLIPQEIAGVFFFSPYVKETYTFSEIIPLLKTAILNREFVNSNGDRYLIRGEQEMKEQKNKEEKSKEEKNSVPAE